ncbi:MAG TPA: response regulator [Leptolyngbyaceae cyanobacterium M33_DOE_097]|uniref:histidine kinase n=1 Tax=Oscillatoriales cyanobacterium SpSt-418 TaxID=2282169 RepID=A0A7C3PDP0_9CYAN|nr:response regulator [Leptolyngbyaceae cyanobacterium M33_DOE_097]
MLQDLSQAKHIQLETNLPPKLPELWVDERRIRQVLINLLSNAVKFTPEGGRITLEARFLPDQETSSKAQKFLQIAVTDTGIGIAPEHIPQLFQPFIQIDSALNRKYEGTGLGLVLVKRLVELHGGKVELTSEVGVGSCFMINLPYIDAAPSLEKSSVSPSTTIALEQPKHETAPLILLAEDNADNVVTLSTYLIAKGYQVLVAENGETAIALTQSNQPDLILMDIQLPKMDGLEAIRLIRHELNLTSLPIIAITALTTEEGRDRSFAAGANAYLSKPLKLKQLNGLIAMLLKQSSAPDSVPEISDNSPMALTSE